MGDYEQDGSIPGLNDDAQTRTIDTQSSLEYDVLGLVRKPSEECITDSHKAYLEEVLVSHVQPAGNWFTLPFWSFHCTRQTDDFDNPPRQ